MKTIFSVLILLLITNICFSQSNSYQFVTNDKNGNSFYVKFEREKFGIKEIWIKMIFPKKEVRETYGARYKISTGYGVSYVKINCIEREFATVFATKYDKNGNVIKQDKVSYIEYQKIIPESLMEVIYRYVCM